MENIRTQRFDCPNCQKTLAAKRSETYPSVVVHKCFGKSLIEVGSYSNGQFLALSTFIKPQHLLSFDSPRFYIFSPVDAKELQEYGQKLNNATSSYARAESYFNDSSNTILIAQSKEDKNVVYMILLSNKTIPGLHYFSGYNLRRIPSEHGGELIKELIRQKLITANPFPNDYLV